MAKRFHQGMKMRDHYAGYDKRIHQEGQDAGMIKADYNAVANLPQDVKYHAFPKAGYPLNEHLNDKMSGIDRQMDKDGHYLKMHEQPEKA